MNKEEILKRASMTAESIAGYAPTSGAVVKTCMSVAANLGCGSTVEDKKQVVSNLYLVHRGGLERAKRNVQDWESLKELIDMTASTKCGGP